MATVESRLKTGLIWLIRSYQRWISPACAARCRFYPSCSSYAVTVIQSQPLLIAVYLILKRLWRCRPAGGSGVDLPPIRQSRKTHENI